MFDDGLDESSAFSDACCWCGKSISFMRFCDGLCVNCGGFMEKLEKAELIRSLAKAVLRVKQLELERG